MRSSLIAVKVLIFYGFVPRSAYRFASGPWLKLYKSGNFFYHFECLVGFWPRFFLKPAKAKGQNSVTTDFSAYIKDYQPLVIEIYKNVNTFLFHYKRMVYRAIRL